MFKFIKKKIIYFNIKKKCLKDNLINDLNNNISFIKNLNDSNDYCFHDINVCNKKGIIIYIDGMINLRDLSQNIIEPLLKFKPKEDASNLIYKLKNEVIIQGNISLIHSFDDLFDSILNGDCVLLLDNYSKGLSISVKGFDKRSVTEPESELVVRGPREGFTENLRTNTTLIRRKIKNEFLINEDFTLGRKTKTKISIMYLKDVCNSNIVKQVRKRLNLIDTDSILESGYIEEFIEDAPFSPFSTVSYSEKPDVIAAKILEGRIAIIIDGTPFVLTVPMLFIENFQTSEDYYSRPFYSLITRLIRYIAFIITVFAPGLYIALTTFHQELIPTTLLITIANAREGTPFPAFIETIIMLFTFEILREAGIRLPRPAGQAISIVGALVMGEAAINAGFVGAPMVITVGITAVCAFIIPTQNESVAVLRIIMLILGAIFGIFGTALGFLFVLFHLSSLKSFGIPYFDGFSKLRNMKDSIVRFPLKFINKRPNELLPKDQRKQINYDFKFRPFEGDDNND